MKIITLLSAFLIPGGLVLLAVWFFKRRKARLAALAEQKLVEQREAFHQARIEEAKTLDTSNMVKVNDVANSRPTFNSRYGNIVVNSPLGIFVGKKTPANYFELARAGFYQDTSWIPVFEKLDSKHDVPYDPETNIAISGKELEHWIQISESWKVESALNGSPDVAYRELQPQFQRNEKDSRNQIH